MKEIFKKIISFLKSIFSNDIETKIDNHSKYNINRNKNCDISITENGGKSEKRK